MKNKSIYIVISHTATRFGKFLRIFGDFEYNHSGISLDKDFNELYAFARPQYKAMVLARLVRETYTSYTLNSDVSIPIKVYKLDVNEEEYDYVKNTIHMIKDDPDFHYNMFSVFTYPFIGGCKVHKTYTCVEFVIHVLKDLGYQIERPCYEYKPEELKDILKDYLFYEGDIRDIMSKENIDVEFFNKLTWKEKKHCVQVLYTVLKRSFHYSK